MLCDIVLLLTATLQLLLILLLRPGSGPFVLVAGAKQGLGAPTCWWCSRRRFGAVTWLLPERRVAQTGFDVVDIFFSRRSVIDDQVRVQQSTSFFLSFVKQMQRCERAVGSKQSFFPWFLDSHFSSDSLTYSHISPSDSKHSPPPNSQHFKDAGLRLMMYTSSYFNPLACSRMKKTKAWATDG